MSLADLDLLRLLPLEVRAIALDPVTFPAFAGSTIRGAFGHALKDAACVVDHRICDVCRLVDECAYPALFEPRPRQGARRLAKQQRAPAPYVLRAPETAGEVRAGEPFSFGVTLVGRAVLLLPLVAAALLRAGERGVAAERSRFRIDRIDGPDGAPVLAGDPPLLSRPGPVAPSSFLAGSELDGGRVRVAFPDAVRLMKDGALARELPFDALVRSLLWRASTLLEFHEGTDLQVDFRGWIERARSVRTVRSELRRVDSLRWSSRQARAMNLRGVCGHVDYEGDLAAFAPLLAIGAAVGVGKGTTFGLGRMCVRAAPGDA